MRRLRIIGALAALTVVVSACSASSQSLDEYADELSTRTDSYVVESQNLSFDYQSEVEDGTRQVIEAGAEDPEAEVLTLFRQGTVEYLALLTDAMVRYRDSLEAMTPPSDVADAHASFLAAVAAVTGAIPDAKVAVEQATSLDEVQLGLTASGFADGQLRWTGTCQTLEQAIVDAGRAMDLRCVRPTDTGGG